MNGGSRPGEHAADEQRQRSVGRLELVALVLEHLDAVEHVAQLGCLVRDVEAQLARLHHDVAASREIADEDVAAVADERGIDVLVAADHFLDRIHVGAALVRERRRAHPGQARIRPDVGRLVDELRELLELRRATRAAPTRRRYLNARIGITLVRLQLPVRSP